MTSETLFTPHDGSTLTRNERQRIINLRVAGIGLYHVVVFAALLPYLFSWGGIIALVLGIVLIAVPGINIGYHRLLTHRGLSCSKTMERVLALLGVLNLQLGPAYWVAVHRRHHHFTELSKDPHSPRPQNGGFLWSHIGWILTVDENTDPTTVVKRYAKDLLADPLYAWLEQDENWFWKTVVPSWGVFFGMGFFGELFFGTGTIGEALRIGLSVLVWGVFVRTVVVWHGTWLVNSASHLWGYRTHDTPDDSRNNAFVGLLAFGEGWHNNHHAFPRSARHGHQWWELDVSWWMIRALAAVGLVKITNVAPQT